MNVQEEGEQNYIEIQTMSASEAAKAWAAKNKIDEDAVERLFEEGFNSLDAIRLLEPDDLPKSKISKGQRKLIIASVQKLNSSEQAGQTEAAAHISAAHSATPSLIVQQQGGVQQVLSDMLSSEEAHVTVPNQTATRSSEPCQSGMLTNPTATGSWGMPPNRAATGSSLPLQPQNQTATGGSGAQTGPSGEDPYLRLLQQWQTGQSIVQNATPSQTGSYGNLNNDILSGPIQTGQSVNKNVPTVESWRDPQIYLARAAFGKSPPSHLDITDFVTGNVEEEIIVGGNGSQQVVLKSGPKKPKLENVTLAQWCVANNAILYKLVCESKLHPNNILDYISYSTKICELVQRFTLLSVLLYDRNYRQLQAQNGFRWGTDVPHLQNVHLIPRMPRSDANQPQKTGPPHPSRTQSTPGPLTLDGRVICKLFNTKGGCHYKECRYVHQCSQSGCHQAHAATTHNQGKN